MQTNHTEPEHTQPDPLSGKDQPGLNVDKMTPRSIVEELNRYIIGQDDAKKAVAIAVRNRARRRMVPEHMRDEIYPRNIIMIGPTGCGKTEIARRLARLTGAPFVKVEATKYTEVGYVGRDVESMVRDLVSTSINLVKKEFRKNVEEDAKKATEERLLDLLLPSSQSSQAPQQSGRSAPSTPEEMMAAFSGMSPMGMQAHSGMAGEGSEPGAPGADVSDQQSSEASSSADNEADRSRRVREMMREKLRNGQFEEREVEVDVTSSQSPMVQVLGGQNMEEIDMQMQNMLGDLMPKKSKKRRVTIEEARKVLLEEELERLIDQDRVQMEAIRRAEQMGIIFIDELDKIAGKQSGGGGGGSPDVSREGVQRDLLPIVEGATIQTKQGPIKTDHILFIAAGAFHMSKPSDLIPELQGRFPIRVELERLTEKDFRAILTGPENSLTRQMQELLGTEGITLDFQEDGLDELASVAFQVNEQTENIGARRLYTIIEKLLEEISFHAPDMNDDEKHVVVNRDFVRHRLHSIVEDRDLSQYIL